MAKASFLTVRGEAADEFIEKKSRFIGQITQAESEEEAGAFLERVKSEHRAATHHCYAWVVGEHGQFQRSSDAGEPAGTAGRPILEAIKRAELQNTVIVVTRYFGGILLGASGLTRAYARAAQAAVQAASLVMCTPARRYALQFDYGLLGKVEAFFAQSGCPIEKKLYAEQVCFLCLMEDAQRETMQATLADLSGGSLFLQDLGEQAVIERPV